MWSQDLYMWFLCRYGEKRVLHGLTTFAMDSTGVAFKKIDNALNLGSEPNQGIETTQQI